jgi:hypothetical protein
MTQRAEQITKQPDAGRDGSPEPKPLIRAMRDDPPLFVQSFASTD